MGPLANSELGQLARLRDRCCTVQICRSVSLMGVALEPMFEARHQPFVASPKHRGARYHKYPRMRFIVRAINNTNNIKQRLCILLSDLVDSKSSISRPPFWSASLQAKLLSHPLSGDLRGLACGHSLKDLTLLKHASRRCDAPLQAVWLFGWLEFLVLHEKFRSAEFPIDPHSADLFWTCPFSWLHVRYYKILYINIYTQRWLRQRAEFLGSILILCRPSSNIQKHLSVHKYWQMPTYRPERHSKHQLDRIWYNSYFWIPGRAVEVCQVYFFEEPQTFQQVVLFWPMLQLRVVPFATVLRVFSWPPSFQTLQKLQYLRFFCSFWAYFPATCGSPLIPGDSISIKCSFWFLLNCFRGLYVASSTVTSKDSQSWQQWHAAPWWQLCRPRP